MTTIDSIKDKIRQLLIENDGDIQSYHLKDIFEEANLIGIDKKQILKISIELDSSINWEHIRQKKQEEKDRLIKFEEEVKKQEEEIKSAPEFIEALVQYTFADGIVESKELELIFEKAEQFKQDTFSLSRKIKEKLDANKYTPHPNPNLNSTNLKDTLLSTNWYNQKHYLELTTPPPPPPTPFPWKKVFVAASLIIATIVIGGYFFWYKPYLKDKNATRMYSYANSLALRSSPAAGGNYNITDNLLFGTEILEYSVNGDWAECKANGKKGYVSTQFLLNKKDFQELNGILADPDTRDAIATTKCRRALLNYFTKRGIIGKIDETIQKDIYGSVQQKEIWQVFTKPKNNNPNNVAYPKVVNPNSKYSDFACIIKNITTGKRKFLLFSFTDDEKETLQSEQDAPLDGYIQSVSKSPYHVQYAF